MAVLGHDLAGLGRRRLRDLRRRVGTVHQHLDLPGPLRVIHNVNAGRLGQMGTLASLASLVRPSSQGLAHDVLAAVGLGSRAWARTDDLSGGEQQRVAIARVLTQGPELLLADEPVASLDPELSRRMLDLLCGDGPSTTIMSLHEPDLARSHADRLVGISEGRIVFDRAAADVSDADLDRLYQGETTG